MLEEIAGEDTAPAVDLAIAPEEVGPPSFEEDCGFILSVEDLDRLPPLPEGLRARSFLADERLGDLITQYRADPKRRLDGLETARAQNILAEARARVEILQSRIRLAIFESAEKLRERGDFVEYAPGEKYYSERGVVSFGEDLGDAGMRMFYLFPEEFPELYRLKEEKKRLPEVAVRQVLGLVNGEGG